MRSTCPSRTVSHHPASRPSPASAAKSILATTPKFPIAPKEADIGGAIAIPACRQDAGELSVRLRAIDRIATQPLPPPLDRAIAHILALLAAKAAEVCVAETLKSNAVGPSPLIVLQVSNSGIPEI